MQKKKKKKQGNHSGYLYAVARNAVKGFCKNYKKKWFIISGVKVSQFQLLVKVLRMENKEK